MAITPIWIIERFSGDAETTIARWYVNGRLQCFGLEDEFHKTKIKTDTRIPEGIYELGFHQSPKFSPIYGHPMIHILNVPNYDFILMHPLNDESQTEGCVGPGQYIGHNGQKHVTINSRVAYLEMYKILAPLIKSGVKQYVEIKSVIWNPYEENPDLINTVAVPPVV